VAIFFAYVHQALQCRRYRVLAAEWQHRAVALANQTPNGFSLFTGILGVAWATEHLRRKLALGDEDPNAVLDEFLLRAVSNEWHGSFDLINGLSGVALYALERHTDCARNIAARCVHLLSTLAEPQAEGCAWRSRSKDRPPRSAAEQSRGKLDLGVAHGAAAVIAVLAEAGRVGVAPAVAASTLQGALTWLFAQELDETSEARFPHFAGERADAMVARCAWCYGDAGIACAILLAARASGRIDWEKRALAAARSAARRRASAGIFDAGLCHGAGGLALIFARLYHATHEALFLEAAVRWATKVLQMRIPGTGIAGYRALAGNPRAWFREAGLLNGAAGIGLALLAASTDVEPEWDSLMLTCVPSIPVRANFDGLALTRVGTPPKSAEKRCSN
jgi:lantibiotic modifying enzyme